MIDLATDLLKEFDQIELDTELATAVYKRHDQANDPEPKDSRDHDFRAAAGLPNDRDHEQRDERASAPRTGRAGTT